MSQNLSPIGPQILIYMMYNVYMFSIKTGINHQIQLLGYPIWTYTAYTQL